MEDKQTAWHGAGHPAEGMQCPRCDARVGKPCVSTLPTALGGSIGATMVGLHRERLDLVRQ